MARSLSRDPAPRFRWLATRLSIALSVIAVVVGLGSWWAVASPGNRQAFDLTDAKYVGREACVTCHAAEMQKHAGSHHDKAMELATPETVLGDFNDVTIEHLGVTSRLFRQGDKYMVNTEGPDGAFHDYEIKYVFGLTPLQQYMVEFDADAANGDRNLPRVQVLRISWDTIQKKWFHLDPPDVSERLAPTDDLHWTGIAQRWNNMCAECHSTNYQKGFDVKSLSYHSTFSEIDVSCEACHGPASKHVELAGKWFPGWNREKGYGLANLKRSPDAQIQACAPCHSRRNVIAAGYQPGHNFYDHYADQLLTAGIYYPDGQVLDEDYIHGSFLQSKMYHKGIRCTDCHDPHTAKLKADGNQVCTSCHQHPTAKYDTVAHHFHKPGTAGASCVNCHMPATTYMAVDARHDHSLRIPRPDLSLELGTPNACTGCHLKPENVDEAKRPKLNLYQDWMSAATGGDEQVKQELTRADRWCNEACDKWYGEKRRRDDHYGVAIAAGQKRAPDAVNLLTRVLEKKPVDVPAIARATALQTLSTVNAASAGDLAVDMIAEPHPLVRAAACDALLGCSSLGKATNLLAAALDDPVRLVRTAAARNLMQIPPDQHPPSITSKLQRAIDEMTSGLNTDNDRAGAHLSLAVMAEQEGRLQSAIEHYRNAIRVEPNVTGARSNLAALLERSVRNISSGGAASAPGTNEKLDGLIKEIADLRKTELGLLERDVGLLPSAASLHYRYGLALFVDGQKEKSLEQLLQAAQLEPSNYEYVQGVTLMYKSQSKWSQAQDWLEKLKRLAPADDRDMRSIEREILQRIP